MGFKGYEAVPRVCVEEFKLVAFPVTAVFSVVYMLSYVVAQVTALTEVAQVVKLIIGFIVIHMGGG